MSNKKRQKVMEGSLFLRMGGKPRRGGGGYEQQKTTKNEEGFSLFTLWDYWGASGAMGMNSKKQRKVMEGLLRSPVGPPRWAFRDTQKHTLRNQVSALRNWTPQIGSKQSFLHNWRPPNRSQRLVFDACHAPNWSQIVLPAQLDPQIGYPVQVALRNGPQWFKMRVKDSNFVS